MAMPLDQQIILEEEIDVNYDPTDQGTPQSALRACLSYPSDYACFMPAHLRPSYKAPGLLSWDMLSWFEECVPQLL